MNAQVIRMAFMAGRGVPLSEIAGHFKTTPAAVRHWLCQAGLRHDLHVGPILCIPFSIEPFLVDIDAIGARRRMCREEIAAEILRVVCCGGPSAINEILDRGEV